LPILQVPHDRPGRMSFSADGKLFLPAAVDSVQMTSLETRDALCRKEFKGTLSAALSPDGRFFAAQPSLEAADPVRLNTGAMLSLHVSGQRRDHFLAITDRFATALCWKV
jgi:hypothetical protein